MTASTVSTDRALQLLADAHRRQALTLLSETDGTVPVAELADEIADDGTDRQPLLVQLRHSHLPKLADAGVVEHDRGRDAVAYRGDATVESLLEWVERVE